MKTFRVKVTESNSRTYTYLVEAKNQEEIEKTFKEHGTDKWHFDKSESQDATEEISSIVDNTEDLK